MESEGVRVSEVIDKIKATASDDVSAWSKIAGDECLRFGFLSPDVH